MRVSENGRYLEYDDGSPFFYLADTAWGLFHQAGDEDAKEYLTARKEQGFTVVMAVILLSLEQEDRILRHGRPFLENDLSRPNEQFFAYADRLIEHANNLGLVMALLPVWGSYVSGGIKGYEAVSLKNALEYGAFLGRRYRRKEIIWVLGGDRNPAGDAAFTDVWPAMAAGINSENDGRQLITYHPEGGFATAHNSSAIWFHGAPWLSYHMRQTSTRLDFDYCAESLQDYNRQSPKPFVDGETRYENSHMFFFKKPPCGVRIAAWHVRQAAYGSLLCGAAGFTYGCRDAWSFYVPSDEPPSRDVDTFWKQALWFEGAQQMRHLKKLFSDFPWYRLSPDQDGRLVIHGNEDPLRRTPGAMAWDKSFAVVYIPEDMPVWVDMKVFRRDEMDALWFDPTEGRFAFIKRYRCAGVEKFDRPTGIQGRDRVLVLYDSSELCGGRTDLLIVEQGKVGLRALTPSGKAGFRWISR